VPINENLLNDGGKYKMGGKKESRKKDPIGREGLIFCLIF
jgi:hypothetical protein